VHDALAEVTDPSVDPDRRAWHRAHGAPGPDEEVAEELECSAGRAQARGGLAAAAAFPERAAMLTPEPARRAQRFLAAARTKRDAGALDARFLYERLPMSRLDIVGAGHFVWEDAADEYAQLVTRWWSGGYATIGTSPTTQETHS
jgi:pimeloyl-ACP methyl ester carboxylesterase